MTKEQQQQELDKLRDATADFYASPAGQTQLTWLQALETNLITNAINATDPAVKLSSLDQAKGVRTFRAYLDTLIPKP